MLQKINSKGQKIGDPVSLGLPWKIGSRSEFLTIDDVYISYEGYVDNNGGSTKQIFMNLLIPSDKPDCPKADCKCSSGTFAVYSESGDGCEKCECADAPIPIYPKDKPQSLATPIPWTPPPPVWTVITEDELSADKCKKVVQVERCSW